MAKYKHLTINERHDIEQCLNKQHSFKEIGRMLNRDPTTIS
ncbi:helix-turn-helix domain-containing protein [Oscillibacter sp.]|nr:helix-turn-helix domain-containing protein [Oscillibacter sp.]